MTLPKGPDSLCFDKDEFMKVGLLYISTIEPVFSCTVTNLISCLVCVLYIWKYCSINLTLFRLY